MRNISLGSLFDGIGAFPYAASIFGTKTLWASEILPAAISVTRRHFPGMTHVGDIMKLNGAMLSPVDVIAFGSPCQDLSQANGGNRKGLAGEHSGLFMEAIRIINEMRCATNGEYPRYAIFENVPGCFSSNSRRDYKAVLEAFAQAGIPMPESGRWATAGMVRSDRAHIAWCVYDACRGFGLAQRRKRVFVVADFGKGSPEQILLVPKSLRWYPPQSFGEGESVAAAAENGAGSASGFDGYNFNVTGSDSSALGVNCGMSTGRNGVISTTKGKLCHHLNVPVVAFNGGASPQAGSIAYSEQVSPTLKSASSGLRTPCVCEPVIARTLMARGDSSPCAGRGQNIFVMPSITMRIRAGCEGGGKGELPPEKNGKLSTGGDQPLFIHPEVAGTLCASAAGLSRPAGMASETDLAVATFCRQRSDTFEQSDIASTQTARQYKDATDLCVYCLQGNMIGRGDKNGPAGSGINENISFTLTGADIPAAAVDCRNLKEIEEVSGTLQAKATQGYSLNYQNPVRCGYTVRRLTPTECERLMGLPDGWTAYGHNGKEISDSKRYSMLGNSIATSCAAYIMQGIVEQYEKGE